MQLKFQMVQLTESFNELALQNYDSAVCEVGDHILEFEDTEGHLRWSQTLRHGGDLRQCELVIHDIRNIQNYSDFQSFVDWRKKVGVFLKEVKDGGVVEDEEEDEEPQNEPRIRYEDFWYKE